MSYNDSGAARLVFDIETCPLPSAADYLEPVSAPANYKDAAKIAAAIAEKRAEQLDKAGLDVDLCRIVAIGYQFTDSQTPHVLTAYDEKDEADALRMFWSLAANRHLVGFNCLSFDLPVLLRRSLYLDIDAPNIQVDRFKHPMVSDLMQILSHNGTLRFRGLSFYAKRFGFGVEDEMTGADICQAVEDGRFYDVEKHVKADVTKTALLADRLGVVTLAEMVL